MAETEKHLGQPLTNNITESPQNNLEQMITGRYFKPNESELVELRKRAETACERFNHVSSQGMGQEEMLRCLRKIVEYDPKKPDNNISPGGGIRVGTGVKVHSPFWVDYGFNIRFGDNVTIKGGCRIEDCREVQIGNNTVIGPGVTISGELHFHDPGYKIWRRGLTIRIGRNVFIGAGVIIAPTDYPATARDAGEIVIGDEAYISPGTVVCSVRNFKKGRVYDQVRTANKIS
jgi:acetyltransferase-like isoleucine patch superfamily enzyme